MYRDKYGKNYRFKQEFELDGIKYPKQIFDKPDELYALGFKKVEVYNTDTLGNPIDETLNYKGNPVETVNGNIIEVRYEVIPKSREQLIPKEINDIKLACTANDPVTMTINTVEYTFNGGDSSAGAINGAITLAQSLSETTVDIWDINNKLHTFTLAEAFTIAQHIAKTYRDAMLDRQTQITVLNEELEAIVNEQTI